MSPNRTLNLRNTRRVERGLARRLDEGVVKQLQRGVIARGSRAHLIHLSKTGGTAMKHVLEPVGRSERFELVLHGHGTRLEDIPQGDKVFFVLRDPLDRFVSGFNSRLRQGRPRYDVPWTEAERIAFEQFETPDRLGQALSSADEDERVRAYSAMISIHNVCDSYWRWFTSREYVDTRLADLLLIAWFPDLDAAFARLVALLGITGAPTLPTGDVEAHRTPDHLDRSLSELARLNLTRWYAADYAFINYCARLPGFVGPSWKTPPAAGLSEGARA